MPSTHARAQNSSGPVALQLDKPAATTLVQRATGGAIAATVARYRDGSDPSGTEQKRLERIVYEELEIEVGLSMPQALFDWIAQSMGSSAVKRNGAVLRTDHNFVVRSQRAFQGAFISQIAFPALDGASKDAGRLALTLTPETILPDTNPGTLLQLALGQAKAKAWIVSNFRLQIDGIDCSKVARIEPFAVRRQVQQVRDGNTGDSRSVPGRVEFPDLRIWIAASGAQTWTSWHKTFVVDPATRGQGSKKGSIELLGPNLGDVLARIKVSDLGIFRLSTDPPAEAGPPAVALVSADLYCEQMTLEAGSP